MGRIVIHIPFTHWELNELILHQERVSTHKCCYLTKALKEISHICSKYEI